MPRVHHVKKARKDNPVAKKGEEYYWWKHAFGAKQFSKTPPRRSQLTQSGFLSEMYDIEDELNAFSGDTLEDIRQDIEDIVERVRQLSDESQDSLDNMPDHLQETSDSGMLLQERVENCDQMIDELEAVDLDDEDADLEDVLSQINDICYQGS
jgi:methyl-accepting chemotaxis protein